MLSVKRLALLSLLVAAPVAAQNIADAVVTPFETLPPIPDEHLLTLLYLHEGEVMECNVTVVVDPRGAVGNAFAQGCPVALRGPTLEAVRAWRFYPPMLGDRAVPGKTQLRIMYVANSVQVDDPLDSGSFLYRVEPTAVPQWSAPPRPNREARAWMVENGVTSYRCRVQFQVSALGVPEQVLTEDCPSALREPVLRRLRRSGLTVEGASPGDGTVYHLDLLIPLE